MTRRYRASISILVRLTAGGKAPRYRQLIEQLRGAILSGRLAPGTVLPSTRALAEDLSIARNTVLQAYDQLAAEGFLEGRAGSGTRVALSSPAAPRAGGPRRAVGVAGRRRSTPRGDAAVALGRYQEPDYLPISGSCAGAFRLGVPAFDRFPFEGWSRLAGRRRRLATHAQLGYGDRRGEPRLRAAIARHISVSRGVRCHADQILVTSGSQAALDLVSRVVIARGDRVWVEEPGYHGAKGAALAAGARLVPVPVDRDGLDVREGVRLVTDASVAFVTPSHQFPLGSSLSLDRRIALLAWAARKRAWIVEDDYDSDYRYDAHPLMALQGLDTEGRVIYVGTFSKTLFPSLRLGFLVAPESLFDSLLRVRTFIEPHPPILQQLTLADFIEQGHYARHLRRTRLVYRLRQEALVRAAESRLDGVLSMQRSGAGMHLVGWLEPGVGEGSIVRAAAARGVLVLGLGSFRLQRRGAPGLVLGYGGVAPSGIRDGVERLRQVLLEDRKG